MTYSGDRPDTGGSALAAEAEGYLLAHGQYAAAREEAAALCAQLPWLTTAQAEEVSRRYVHHRLDLTRRILRTTAERAEQLRDEYESRYAALRRDLLKRHAAAAAVVLACATGLGALTSTLTR
ncbi:hypothetical protein ACLGIH_32825 [Streptomyces sp. HMX87]|uniref:hypothetical protein n=1 Tax=Streptomyces sp. HMX87 TaxID=3390849 RepID=UPI003A8600D3